ncbi:hypothetical protein [Nonomuraea sp. NPDC005501]|uniref:hypothetical protein n=1 Tax=Nonomuraea sp. NPDC005501 TaxID=3156884 RepID=UPI0033AA4EE1
MSSGNGLMAAVLAGSVGFTAVPAPAGPDAADAGRTATRHGSDRTGTVTRQGNDRTGTVTLITGDRVVVTSAGHRVEPGPGRQRFVSLRAKVTDAASDRVTQTITRAYAVG